MYRIVVYYFQWLEKVQDVIQREEAIFDAIKYWWADSHFVLDLKNGHRLILPQNRYIQIVPMGKKETYKEFQDRKIKEQSIKNTKTIEEEIENARKSPE